MADSERAKPELTPLARELTRRMKAAGLTQKALALEAGLNETAVRDIRGGRSRHPRHDTIEKLASALNCPVMALLAPGSADAVGETVGSAPAPNIGKPSGDAPALPVPARSSAVGSDVASLPLFDGAVRAPQPLDGSKARVRWPVSRLLVNEIAGGDASRLAAVVVRGNAMVPTLADGDLALADIHAQGVTRDGFYLLHHAGGLIARRLTIGADDETVTVICDNVAFSPPRVVSARSLTIAGRVVWLGQRV